jgi:hypothetical protein
MDDQRMQRYAEDLVGQHDYSLSTDTSHGSSRTLGLGGSTR